VVAEGTGADPDDALKDAFRGAIQQVVGALVDAETLIRNDKVISDKVLTYSDGVIKTYKEISRRRVKGLWKVKISAVVERRSVAERLHEVGVTTKEVEGKDLAAEVLTRTEARAKATELLQDVLKDLPKALVAEAQKPSARDYDEDAKTLRVRITVRADSAKYRTFLRRLTSILEKVRLAKDSLLVQSKPSPLDPEQCISEHGSFPPLKLPADQKGWYLWVLTNIDGLGFQSRWDVYLVDSNATKSLSGLLGEWSILLTFRDADGGGITEHEVPFRDDEGRLLHAGRRLYGHGRREIGPPRLWHWLFASVILPGGNPADIMHPVESLNVHIAPIGFRQRSSMDKYLMYRSSEVLDTKISMTEGELKRLKDIRCTLQIRPPDEK
jgi:hypothetical protein